MLCAFSDSNNPKSYHLNCKLLWAHWNCLNVFFHFHNPESHEFWKNVRHSLRDGSPFPFPLDAILKLSWTLEISIKLQFPLRIKHSQQIAWGRVVVIAECSGFFPPSVSNRELLFINCLEMLQSDHCSLMQVLRC